MEGAGGHRVTRIFVLIAATLIVSVTVVLVINATGLNQLASSLARVRQSDVEAAFLASTIALPCNFVIQAVVVLLLKLALVVDFAVSLSIASSRQLPSTQRRINTTLIVRRITPVLVLHLALGPLPASPLSIFVGEIETVQASFITGSVPALESLNNLVQGLVVVAVLVSVAIDKRVTFARRVCASTVVEVSKQFRITMMLPLLISRGTVVPEVAVRVRIAGSGISEEAAVVLNMLLWAAGIFRLIDIRYIIIFRATYEYTGFAVLL